MFLNASFHGDQVRETVGKEDDGGEDPEAHDDGKAMGPGGEEDGDEYDGGSLLGIVRNVEG